MQPVTHLGEGVKSGGRGGAGRAGLGEARLRRTCDTEPSFSRPPFLTRRLGISDMTRALAIGRSD